MRRTTILLLALIVVSITFTTKAMAEDSAPGKTIGFWTIKLQADVSITDTKYVPHPMLLGPPTLSGVDLVLTSVETESGEPVPALVLKALREAKNRVPSSMSRQAGVLDLLKAHRKPLGLGVYGPFTAKGRLFLVIVPKGDKMRLSATFTPEEMTGPKGSWTK